ncbi:DNA internalization-related competence protein ComEC/Rec2 [Desulfomonile tiedjei]|uniref:DNA internalization-related competence protein ComEC/Rec2 n=1 Tax=Desulfomonile tiedjei TaxID=2358 RepID=UPI00059D2608|nr:DNA internalization-related competence protein ComEC/Rec2 [Desulfomonile tiedjei]
MGALAFPAVFGVAALMAGIICESSYAVGMENWTLIAFVPGLVLVFAIVRTDRVVLAWIAAALIFFLIGREITHKQLELGRDFTAPASKTVIHASVGMLWASGERFRTFFVDNGFDAERGIDLPGRGRLVVRNNDIPLCSGDRIAFRSRLRKPLNRGNPGEYDWEIECKHNNIVWLASADGPDSLAIISRASGLSPSAAVFKTRDYVAQFLDLHSGKILSACLPNYFSSATQAKVHGFVKGILLGDQGEIDYSVQQSFSSSGLVHVLSASGLHVGIVVAISFLFVKICFHLWPEALLWMPYRVAGAIFSIPAVIFYCSLIGARVPAVRSGIMALVVAAGILMSKRWNSLNTLAVAALIILLGNPLALFTPGFQLSFLAVGGIILIVPEFTRNLTAMQGPFDSERSWSARAIRRVCWYFVLIMVTSLAATLAITPILLQLFHSFPVWTLAANLITDFALLPILGCGLVAPGAALLSSSVGACFIAVADVFSWFVIGVAEFFAYIPGSPLYVPHLSLNQLILCWAMCLFFLWFLRNPSKRRVRIALAGVASFLILGGSILFSPEDPELKAVFLNVGKADAAFVQPPGSGGMLVDGGLKTSYFDAGRSIVLPFFQWQGTRRVDAVLISHPQMDHMGGLLTVVKLIPVGSLFWNPVGDRPRHLADIIGHFPSDRVLSANREHPGVQVGRAVLTFLNPAQSQKTRMSGKELNNASVVARLDYGEISFLFTGDLEREGEEELLSSDLNLCASVLKVAHHGGRTSTSRQFVEAVKPRIAIISGESPMTRTGPHHEIIERLQSAGAHVFITGRDGAITVQSDGKRLYITTGSRYGDGPRLVKRAYD